MNQRRNDQKLLGHWQSIFHRRRKKQHKTEEEILFGQFVSLVGAVIAGVLLDAGKETFAAVAGAFVVLPAVFDLGGAVAGALGAKIGHAYEFQPGAILAVARRSVLYSLGVAGLASLFLGIFAGLLTILFFDGSFFKIVHVTVLATALTACLGLPLVAYASVKTAQMGHDTDNIIGPFETSLFDVLSVASLLVVLSVVA